MTWGSLHEGQKAAQQCELLFTVERDRRPVLRTGYHGTQNQKQDFVERIKNLRLLTRIFHSLKMGQKIRVWVVLPGVGHAKSPKKAPFHTLDSEKRTNVSNLSHSITLVITHPPLALKALA